MSIIVGCTSEADTPSLVMVLSGRFYPVDTGKGRNSMGSFFALLNMRRVIASFLALVFVAGVLIFPTLHLAYCADKHDVHRAEQCPVCQLASTPVVASISYVEPVARLLPLGLVSFPLSLSPYIVLTGPAEGRAPPAA